MDEAVYLFLCFYMTLNPTNSLFKFISAEFVIYNFSLLSIIDFFYILTIFLLECKCNLISNRRNPVFCSLSTNNPPPLFLNLVFFLFMLI